MWEANEASPMPVLWLVIDASQEGKGILRRAYHHPGVRIQNPERVAGVNTAEDQKECTPTNVSWNWGQGRPGNAGS